MGDSVRLFEREIQGKMLQSLVGACVTGRGNTVLIEGVAGSGRTALLTAAAEDAEEAGLQVMRATCSPMETDLEGSVLDQLLHSVPDSGALAETEAPGRNEFCREILRRSLTRPLLVAVDDLHCADPASARCLLYLARRIAASRVLLVVTRRRDVTPASGSDDELFGEPVAQRLDVDLLSVTGTAQLLAERLGSHLATPALAAEMHRITGGNPLLLDALAADHRRHERAAADDPRGPVDEAAGSHPDSGDTDATGADYVDPHGYGAALVAMVRRGDPAALATVRALAVLGARSTPQRLARLAGLDRNTGAAAVERTMIAMTAAGVLRDGGFPHPAVRTAVLDTVTGAERTDLNQRAATLLHGLGEPATAVARHLLEAQRCEAPWAVPVVVEAAEQELLAERNRRAAQYLELALECAVQPQDRATVLERLTEAEWRRSPSAAVRHLPALVAAARAGHLAPEALPGLVRRLLWHGRQNDAAAVTDRLREAAAAHQMLADGARDLDSWLVFSHPEFGHRSAPPAPARPVSGAPQGVRGAPAPSGGDPWLGTAASLCEALATGRGGDRAGRLVQSLRSLRPRGNTAWGQETASLALLGLLDLDLPDVVLEQCAALTADGAVDQAPTWHALLAAVRAAALLRRGELTGALDGARQALTLLPAHAWGVAVGFPTATLVTAAVRSGNLDEAARHLAFAPPDAMYRSRFGLHYLHARGQFHLAGERGYAGLADFLACGDLARAHGLDAAAPVPWRTSAAEAWLQLGNDAKARRLVREQLSRSDAAGGCGRGRSLRTLAAVSTPERRPQLLLEAVELFEESGDRYEQAQLLADLGRAYSALGDSRRARPTLRRARHLAQLCGAEPLCKELLAIQGAADTPTPPEDDTWRLTESERRVAHLAVLGYTNREIAAKLYVTSSTVEQHLTRVYRKLRVKRRKDLPADLGTTPLRRGAGRLQPTPARRSAS